MFVPWSLHVYLWRQVTCGHPGHDTNNPPSKGIIIVVAAYTHIHVTVAAYRYRSKETLVQVDGFEYELETPPEEMALHVAIPALIWY